MELNTKAKWLEEKSMDLELRYGLMEQSIKAIGIKVKQLERVFSLMFMVIHIMDNGKMIKLMAMVFMFIQKLELNMKGIGRMICSMDQE